GVSALETDRVTREIEGIVREMPDVVSVFTTAGGQLFGGSTNESAGRGNLDMVLLPASQRTMSADGWVRELQSRIDARGFPGAQIFVRPPRIRGLRTSNSGSAVALNIQGDDLDQLRTIGDELLAMLQGVPGLENLEPSAEDASQQLSIELDRERASYLGLSVASVGQTLRTALDGTVATRFTAGSQEYDLRVMFPRERFVGPEDIGSIALFPGMSDGAPVYVRDIADVHMVMGPTEIRRENQNRQFRLTGDVIAEVASVGTVNDSIRARIAGYALPDGYSLVFAGEEE